MAAVNPIELERHPRGGSAVQRMNRLPPATWVGKRCPRMTTEEIPNVPLTVAAVQPCSDAVLALFGRCPIGVRTWVF
jgi:hypothetical protein